MRIQAPIQGLLCTPWAVAGTLEDTAVLRHIEQPRDRWWERKGSLRSHILGNSQQSQLRFSKLLQSESAASSLTCQQTCLWRLAPPLTRGSSAKLCSPPPNTPFLGSVSHGVGVSRRRAPSQGPVYLAHSLLRARSLKLPRSSVV